MTSVDFGKRFHTTLPSIAEDVLVMVDTGALQKVTEKPLKKPFLKLKRFISSGYLTKILLTVMIISFSGLEELEDSRLHSSNM